VSRPGGAETLALTALALTAFAANSLLCRMALRLDDVIDPVSFTTVRLVAGAVALLPLARQPVRTTFSQGGSWASALALFAYAIGFSLAYVSLNTASGALILFGAVQITMVLVSVVSGERPRIVQWAGLAMAISGLLYFLLPGAAAPSLGGGLLMTIAGVAWGVYTLRGRGVANPLAVTASNFVRAVVPALVIGGLLWSSAHASTRGLILAGLSGAVTSGLGYVVWYRALRGHTATTAAVVQLAVPLLAAAGGVVLLGEAPTVQLAIASVLTLGGIALTLLTKRSAAGSTRA
jgi:drug/metabolite transporter (DMT)-like permease